MATFEWDDFKAVSNRKKHGVDFADAVSVLEDEHALTVEEAVFGEDRLVTIGTDLLGRVLVVVYTWRGERIRIISARKATRRERMTYEVRR
jgi:hypothetical protein